ncbi:DUF4271 domain-containing protein [Echinicola jeungdonensis]|uniref:DUF4271 domain-containing protein n=2 Tax=Echinicola jeungdonensis TaxID=709343 RepID=A0ABV5J357_9BACT
MGFFLGSQALGQVLENYNPGIRIENKYDFVRSPIQAEVEVNLVDFPSSSLAIKLPATSAVFLDGKMWFYAQSDTSFLISISQLRKEFVPKNATSTPIVIHKQGILKEEISIKKGLFVEIAEEEVSTDPSFRELREKSSMEDFIYLAFIIILGLMALFRVTYPLVFLNSLKPGAVFSADEFSDHSVVSKVFSSDVIFYLLIFSMVVMLFLMAGFSFMELPAWEMVDADDLNFLLLVWLSGTAVFMVLSFLKFFWIKAFTRIYQFEKYDFHQFMFLLRVLLLVLLVIFFLVIVCYSQGYLDMKKVVEYMVTSFLVIYLLGIFRLFNLMKRKVSFKNYHLFSYICSSELVPFLVIVKLIMG